MNTRTNDPIRLRDILPNAAFGERHRAIIEAPPDAVWDAVQALSWSDLTLTRPLLAIRGLTAMGIDGACMTTLSTHGAVASDPPRTWAFAAIGRPWSLVPAFVPAESPGRVRDFDEPGWLKYGMEWRLTALPGDRTLLETTTRCTPTDLRARLLFGAYWTVIRIGSDLIRRDMIRGVRARAETREAASG